jgi:RNA polymerase subunit RPABC4/transcription elongation factor Spt4
VQTCTQCHQQSSDAVRYCQNCGADLQEYSSFAVALKKFRENPRVKGVRIVVDDDACPVCQQMRGSYPLDQVPTLPVKGCSHPQGCRCFYAPLLERIYP